MNITTLISDPALLSIIKDAGIAYIDRDGSICTSDATAPVIKDIADVFRNSKSAFGGKYYGLHPRIRLVDQETVNEHLGEMRGSDKRASVADISHSSDAAKKLRRLLEDVVARGASDIHIRNIIGVSTQINIRVNGDFIKLRDQDAEYGEEILTYIVMNLAGGRDYSIKGYADHKFQMPLRETRVVDGEEAVIERETYWRFAQIPVNRGSKVTIRNLNTGGDKPPTMESLGLLPGHVREITQLMKTGEGLMLITGPTGSGKTTLINSALECTPTNKNIHTLEDPVEWNMTGRNAVQTLVEEGFVDADGNKPRGFFANSLRLLRHDTDVVFFGEIRELESAGQALRMSETGQFVVGTLHTNSAISSVSTLVEKMGITASQLSSPGVLRALGHQRLVKKLCPSCKLTHEQAQEIAHEHERLQLSISYNEMLEMDLDGVRYPNPVGCEKCDFTGEPGRTAVFELVMIDRKCREFIKVMDLNGLQDHLKSLGWPSIREHGLYKLQQGLVDVCSLADRVDGVIPMNAENIYRSVFDEVAD